MPFIAIVLIAALALGGGMSVAARAALPGNLLYPLKTDVDENITGAFALSNVARANWDINAIDERLKEAAELSARGVLSAGEQAQITDNFDSHLYDTHSIIVKLKSENDTQDAAALSTRLEGVLSAHASELAQAGAAENADVQSSLVPIVGEVEGALGALSVTSETTTTANTDK